MTPEPSSGTPSLQSLATLLIVEDEPAVRMLMVRALSREPYQLQFAEAPSEALQIASDPALRLDVVVIDLGLPEMSGFALGLKIRELHPRVALVFDSGYSERDWPKGPRPSDYLFLEKPFTPEELRACVRKALRSSEHHDLAS
jgi:two-component system cell cycle sensor histidine kinase/response regulator CckA